MLDPYTVSDWIYWMGWGEHGHSSFQGYCLPERGHIGVRPWGSSSPRDPSTWWVDQRSEQNGIHTVLPCTHHYVMELPDLFIIFLFEGTWSWWAISDLVRHYDEPSSTGKFSVKMSCNSVLFQMSDEKSKIPLERPPVVMCWTGRLPPFCFR
jgi:hypothetical protein